MNRCKKHYWKTETVKLNGSKWKIKKCMMCGIVSEDYDQGYSMGHKGLQKVKK